MEQIGQFLKSASQKSGVQLTEISHHEMLNADSQLQALDLQLIQDLKEVEDETSDRAGSRKPESYDNEDYQPADINEEGSDTESPIKREAKEINVSSASDSVRSKKVA